MQWNIERFHRSLKEEEVWPAEYRNLDEAREHHIGYLWEYNHDRRVGDCGTALPPETYVTLKSDLKTEALSV